MKQEPETIYWSSGLVKQTQLSRSSWRRGRNAVKHDGGKHAKTKGKNAGEEAGKAREKKTLENEKTRKRKAEETQQGSVQWREWASKERKTAEVKKRIKEGWRQRNEKSKRIRREGKEYSGGNEKAKEKTEEKEGIKEEGRQGNEKPKKIRREGKEYSEVIEERTKKKKVKGIRGRKEYTKENEASARKGRNLKE